MTFLMSPGARMLNSSLNFPVEPPSSQTDTTAVISRGYCFKPLRRQLRPVPPPKTTTILLNLTTF